MTIHAYRVISHIHDSVDMEADAFQQKLETARADARSRVRQMGGDPLPHEQVVLRANVEAHTLRMIWRSRLTPPDADRLVQSIREQAQNADTVVRWRLEYHVCGNGVGRPCQPWQTIIEEEA